jgi:hypothetical protein
MIVDDFACAKSVPSDWRKLSSEQSQCRTVLDLSPFHLSIKGPRMGDFFQGWQRKAGCMALVTACVVVGVWVRSLYFHECFYFRIDSHQICAADTNKSRLLFFYVKEYGPNHIAFLRSFYSKPADDSTWPPKDFELETNWRLCGLEIGSLAGTVAQNRRKITYCFIPHWMFAIPLILLSAWLLWCKPRKPKIPADFTSTTGSPLPVVKRELKASGSVGHGLLSPTKNLPAFRH